MTQRIQQKPAAQIQTKKPEAESVSTSFSDHIAELRRRIFFVLLAFLVASSLAYNYRDQLLAAIMSPLGGEKLIYLTPGGGFNFIFQISLYAGIIAAAPVLIYQLYGFIRPALPKRAQRSASLVVLVAFLLMLCGVAFGYFVAVPSALHFLSNFAGDNVSPNLTADSYLSFFLAYIAGLGVLFELPLLLLFLHWIHPMTPGKLLKSERFVILFAFVVAALITPTPDMFNQAMIALPLILIYQMGVVAVLVAIKRDRRRERREEQHARKASTGEAPRKVSDKPIGIEPTSKPVQLVIQPAVSSSAAKPSAQVRSLDGFARQNVTSPRAPRPLTPPARSKPVVLTPPERPIYRRPLSIDGFTIR